MQFLKTKNLIAKAIVHTQLVPTHLVSMSIHKAIPTPTGIINTSQLL